MEKSSNIDFEDVVLRKEISYRGGGIEIDLTPFGFEGEKMSVYQNYLGGGMLGRICVNDTMTAYNKKISKSKKNKLETLGENLKMYFHSLTDPGENYWEHQTFEQNQKMPVSGY